MRKGYILKTRILFISHTSKLGGGEHSLLNIIREIDKQKFEIFVICPVDKGDFVDKIKKIGDIHLYYVKQPEINNSPIILKSVIEANFKIIKIIKDNKIDIVHANSTRATLYSIFASKYTKTYHITHIRSFNFGSNKLENLIVSKILKLSDKIIAVSDTIKNELLELGSFSDNKIKRIYNGINIHKFENSNKNKLHDDFGLKNSDILIGIVGRLVPWKGFETFIKAANLVENKNCKFLIIGDTIFDKNLYYKDELKKLINKLNLNDKIILTGYRNDIREIMGELDIFVMASEREAFGRTVVEAMASKTMVIVSDSGGPSEIIVNETQIFPPGDHIELANKIKKITSNKELKRKMEDDSYLIAKNKFSLERLVCDIEKLYFNYKDID